MTGVAGLQPIHPTTPREAITGPVPEHTSSGRATLYRYAGRRANPPEVAERHWPAMGRGNDSPELPSRILPSRLVHPGRGGVLDRVQLRGQDHLESGSGHARSAAARWWIAGLRHGLAAPRRVHGVS